MLTRKRKLLFALVSAVMVSGVLVLLLLAADIYAHWRTQDVAGVNVWGYRGEPIGKKAQGEIRVVMLGGSTVFGWGLPAHESIPAFLERRLNATPGRRYSVVNLGAPGEGVYGFRFGLEDFEDLDYDVVILYEGYNDLGPYTIRGRENYLLWRHESPIFRWTGYYPLLPVVLREKADVLSRDQGNSVRFGTRVGADVMRTVGELTAFLGGQPGGLTVAPEDVAADGECRDGWERYCGSVRTAIDWSLERGKSVIVASQPYISDAHVSQQANLAAMVRARYGARPSVRYLDLGRVVDMRDTAIAYDGIHLVAAGNDRIAAELVAPIVEISQ